MILDKFRRISKQRATNISVKKALNSKSKLAHKILIGTHHKTGTVWLTSIFQQICLYHSLKFSVESPNFQVEQPHKMPQDFDIFLETHSIFDLDALNSPFRGLHMIRDPRDVIVSGCFYHQKSQEKWLLRSQSKFQGLTYQEKINSYSNLDDKILFEMENVAHNAINEMLKWDYTNPLFYEIKYEELIEDYDLMLFHQIFSFLGFPAEAIPSLLIIAYNNSLFSNKNIKTKHIRSGKKNQWQKYFKPIHKERFLQLFGNCLVRLNYEKDNNWS